MTLVAGTKLGPYEILAPLGAGGTRGAHKAAVSARMATHECREGNQPVRSPFSEALLARACFFPARLNTLWGAVPKALLRVHSKALERSTREPDE
jgi:hypothetical protein